MRAADQILEQMKRARTGGATSEQPAEIFDVAATPRGLLVTLTDGRVHPVPMAERAAETLRHRWLADLAAEDEAERQRKEQGR